MSWIVNDRCKLWKIEDKGNYTEVTFSISRKVNPKLASDVELVNAGIAKNNYVSSNFSFVRFVGHAHNKIKEFTTDDSITNLEMVERLEPFISKSTGQIEYPKNPQRIVFNFEAWIPQNGGIDKAPQVDNSNAPAYQAYQPIVEESVIDDEEAEDDEDCPF